MGANTLIKYFLDMEKIDKYNVNFKITERKGHIEWVENYHGSDSDYFVSEDGSFRSLDTGYKTFKEAEKVGMQIITRGFKDYLNTYGKLRDAFSERFPREL